MIAKKVAVALLVVPFVWAAAFAADAAGKAPQTLTPRQLLIKRVTSVSLAKMPLMRVLKRYSALSGLTINADWKALEAAGVTKETLVTLKTRPMRFSKLLDFTLSSIARKNRPLAWRLSGKEVIISTQMQVLLRGQVTRLPLGLARDVPVARSSGGAREINFKETPLNLVIDFFRDLAGVNFHVNWRALESAGITKETPVTLKVKDVSVGRALDLVLDQLNVGHDRYNSLYWVIDEGVVQIATGESLDRTTRVRVYDISDLLMVVPNFTGPRIDLGNASTNGGSGNTGNRSGGGGFFSQSSDTNTGTSSGTGEEEDMGAQRQRIRDTLIEIIKLSIGADMWADSGTGKGSIRILHNQLIISQTPLGFKLLEQAFRR